MRITENRNDLEKVPQFFLKKFFNIIHKYKQSIIFIYSVVLYSNDCGVRV